MKLLTNLMLSLVVIVAGAFTGLKLLDSTSHGQTADYHAMGEGHHEAAVGPHGGRLLKSDDLAIEVTVHESGVPPEFRVYAYRSGKPLAADDFDVEITLARLGGQKEKLTFEARQDYRVSRDTVTEPHSFDVRVEATSGGTEHVWSYEQHEGRTTITAEQAAAAGITTEVAGPETINQTISLQGRVRYDAGRVRQVRARYPGLVQNTTKSVGDRVRAGEVLARVESNDSLQTYAVNASIDGVVTAQQTGAGEAVTSDQVIYTIANLDRVWVDLAVFHNQMDQIETGQPVHLKSLNGSLETSARIDYLLPVADSHSQTTTARIYLDNPDGRWRPGMAVRATVTVEKTDVPLAVRNSALQIFRDFDVVYAQYGDVYEVRMLELGRSDATHTQVLGGLEPGTEYVVDNSFLLKADIEKSGASHAH